MLTPAISSRCLPCALMLTMVGTLHSQQTPPAANTKPVQVAATLAPLIDSVPADLVVPPLVRGNAAPGKRVRQVLPSWKDTEVHHTLYLPTDYNGVPTGNSDAESLFPMIIEFAGNGGYRNSLGDVSTGVPEGSKLGYGITGGEGFLWVCLPYINGNRTGIATQWWGDAPTYDPEPTIDYCKEAVAWICQEYRVDPDRLILAGFSRGAIACNFLGMHDDEVSRLWCGFIAYSHYDGVRRWPYAGSDRASAIVRLRRLGNRPQLICQEAARAGHGTSATRKWLESTGIDGDFTFVDTGFRNHNDAWVLRPSRARDKIRSWLAPFK